MFYRMGKFCTSNCNLLAVSSFLKNFPVNLQQIPTGVTTFLKRSQPVVLLSNKLR